MLFIVAAFHAIAGDLEFSDPARVAAPPADAVGYPNRSADLDVLPGFRKPPAGYGEVAFYWWLGDPLTKERLTWQMDQLAGKGTMGLQINYAHSDRGGRSYGLSFPSDPPVFSDKWWELVHWFVKEARSRGMAVSLSDYTLGIGQGFIMDEIIRDDPGLRGTMLASASKDIDGGREVLWDTPEGTIGVTAYRVAAGKLDAGSATDLRGNIKDGTLRWNTPAGKWQIIAVSAKVNPWSVDPLNPKTGNQYAAKFFQRFVDNNPGEAGKGLNFFFSDELEFGVHGNLWTGRFAEEFKRRKGYDLVPELPALFAEIGPRTTKVRLDYRDVMVSLTEEGFFRPNFEWHNKNGMIYGCDHGGRGRNVVEFGDYFRTQRWMSGPGCDQPGLGRDVIKNKVASSISHLYLRPRTWIEGYYGSGWGTTPEALADATFANFAMGQNLLTFHGLYYSTHGGWWEWAPPCNHYHMPYWTHMGTFLACTQRLSYVLSQGHHRCDVAVLYPVAPMEAGLGGQEAVDAAFTVGRDLYAAGVDFDFMDFESLDRAVVKDGKLCVSGEEYRTLVLPAMRAVRYSTMQKAAEFIRGKGMVAAVRALPEASDRIGADDAELDSLVKSVFGTTAKKTKMLDNVQARQTDGGGIAIMTGKAAAILAEMDKVFPRDFSIAGSAKAPQIMHRREGNRDVYFVYGGTQGAECTFRAKGRVELWNPWNGETRELAVLSQTADVTKLRLPLGEKEPQLIVFTPGEAKIEKESPAAPKPAEIALDGNWEFALKPTMDNRFGDYRWPAFAGFIGAEARQFRYVDETQANPGWEKPETDDSKWAKVTYAFGPKFWKLGPLPDGADTAALEEQLTKLDRVDPSAAVQVGGKQYAWKPYNFSWRWGIEGDPGHQGYHGLKEEMSDEFIGLGKLQTSGTGTSYAKEPEGSRCYLFTSVAAPVESSGRIAVGGTRPAVIWFNHAKRKQPGGPAALKAGGNPLLARFDAPGRSSIIVGSAGKLGDGDDSTVFSADAKYIWYPNDKTTNDRFFRRTFDVTDVPAKALLRITCDNGYTVFVNGAEIGSGTQWERVQEYNVAAKLRPGRNIIAVRGHNDGADAGLIAEIRSGSITLVATDASWRCAEKDEVKWLEEGFAENKWRQAEALATFADSLWFKHQNGPPQLESPAAAAPARTGTLAMSWYNNAGVLPFDTRPDEASPAGWYHFTAAPGLKAMTIVARGRLRAWADGVELKVAPCELEPAKRTDVKATSYRAELPQPAAVCAKISLRIEQDRGCYGGAAIPEPILLECDKGTLAAGDWSQIDGLACYSGGAWYRKTITLTPEQATNGVMLDLGKVAGSVEMHVNGKPAGVRVAPPWQFDLTGLVKPGENRVEVLVYNTLANHYATIPTRYRGSPVSGLLGPVTVRSGARSTGFSRE